MLFGSQAPEWTMTIPSEPDSTFAVSNPSDLSVADFCSRPILVKHIEWIPGTTLLEYINPWTLFFENKRVINRISNYRALRCKLCVRFLVSGTPFHFGRAMVTYTPLRSRDEYFTDRVSGTVGSPPVWQDAILTSQKPRIFLDPTTSEGGTMCLPFLWDKNALDIVQSDWRKMGELTLRSLNTLRHANAGTSTADISVYVWAEDVHLSFATSTPPVTLVPQSGDEFGDGVVSRPAAAIAAAAGKLTSVPVIGPYAKSTQVAASAVSSVAKHFGMSRPAIISPPTIVRPRYGSSLANTSVPDTVDSLTFDVKQELTVDTRTFGLAGVDEMSISHIASVESYLGTFNLNVTDSTDKLLWNTRVDPFLYVMRTNPITFAQEHFLPATAFVAMPFDKWSGTMRFRFQIASAAAHRAKLRFVYDPVYAHNTYNSLPEEQNLARTVVVDISQDRDFTLDVGWGQTQTMVRRLTYVSGRMAGNTSIPLPATFAGHANGILSVYVQNTLSTPNSLVLDPIEINVFVSAGPDFRVYEPTDVDMKGMSFNMDKPPAALEAQSAESSDSTPTSAEIVARLSPMNESAQSDLVFYADPVMSVRQLLRRYTYQHYTASEAQLGGSVPYLLRQEVFSSLPPPRGWVSIDPMYSNSYNYTNMTPMSYFMSAYAAWRGSTRYKIYCLNTASTSGTYGGVKNHLAVVERITNDQGYPWRLSQNVQVPFGSGATSFLACTKQMIEFMGTMWQGAIVRPLPMDPTIEFEIPFYSNLRFISPRTRNVRDSGAPQALLRTFNSDQGNATGTHNFIAAGEDLTLGMYLGPPIMYRVTLPAS